MKNRKMHRTDPDAPTQRAPVAPQFEALTTDELDRVAGGFNPQPEPPASYLPPSFRPPRIRWSFR